jgi:hypothetical protein
MPVKRFSVINPKINFDEDQVYYLKTYYFCFSSSCLHAKSVTKYVLIKYVLINTNLSSGK